MLHLGKLSRTLIKVDTNLVSGKHRGPNNHTIFGVTNERAQIRSRDPRDTDI